MAVKLILVRHGQTDWNKEFRLQGVTDIPLNEEGKEQARETAKKLKKYGIKPYVIISSSLKRARCTSFIISSAFEIPFAVHENLIERNFGSLEGKNWKEICKLYPDLKRKDRKQAYNYQPFGGESSLDVFKRLVGFINFVKNNYEEKTVIVVTHAGVLRMLFFMYRNQGLNFRQETKTGEYYRLEI